MGWDLWPFYVRTIIPPLWTIQTQKEVIFGKQKISMYIYIVIHAYIYIHIRTL